MYSLRDNSITRPDRVVHPKHRRRASGEPVRRRKRSLSSGSIQSPPILDSNNDPFAWLRQTIQEQREHPILPPDLYNQQGRASTPSTPVASTSGSGSATTPSPTKPDYFGASFLSLIAGRGPVQERIQEHVKRSSLDGLGSPEPQSPHHPTPAHAHTEGSSPKFSLPILPQLQMPQIQAPSLPKWQGASLPNWQAPSLPSWAAPPALPHFPAPSLPSFDTLLKGTSGSASEGESQKYMDEEDQTGGDEPDWARVKKNYQKPKLPLVFLHGLFGFSVIGPSSVPALQIQYWRGVREALEQIGCEVLMTASPASGSE